MKIYITGSERVSECHLKVHETNLNALFSYYHISLISVPVRNCTRMWTNCWHLALFTAEYSLWVNKSGMVTFPQWKASLLYTWQSWETQSCFVREINVSIQKSNYSELFFRLFSNYPQKPVASWNSNDNAQALSFEFQEAIWIYMQTSQCVLLTLRSLQIYDLAEWAWLWEIQCLKLSR